MASRPRAFRPIYPLAGSWEFERTTGGTPESQEARRSGEDYLLKRSLFRRLSTGEPAYERFLYLLHPNRWHYDVLRGLDYFRSAAALTGAAPDPRLGEAIDHVRSRRLEDGTWPSTGAPRKSPTRLAIPASTASER